MKINLSSSVRVSFTFFFRCVCFAWSYNLLASLVFPLHRSILPTKSFLCYFMLRSFNYIINFMLKNGRNKFFLSFCRIFVFRPDITVEYHGCSSGNVINVSVPVSGYGQVHIKVYIICQFGTLTQNLLIVMKMLLPATLSVILSATL